MVLAVVASALGSEPARAATPQLATQASSSGFPVGVQIFDVATLGQGQNPTGTITFELYGPNNATCSGPPIFTSTKTVSGNGNYTSDSFTTTAAGTYQWIARYSGDANNTPVATACGDPAEQTSVTKRTPTLNTQASLVSVGGTITDTATLASGAGPAGPTGTITFELFGPNNLTCADPPIFTSTIPVTGNGTYTSGPFSPPAPGTYQWLATYSGDANNNAVGTVCVDPAETVVVASVGLITPTLTTTASPGVPVGGQLTDQATLSGGVAPTGSITFTLFGPNDATCSGPPVSMSTRSVLGNGTYTSDPFTPTAAGTYRWRAAYSGDLTHVPVSTACTDPAETVTVVPTTSTSTTSTSTSTSTTSTSTSSTSSSSSTSTTLPSTTSSTSTTLPSTTSSTSTTRPSTTSSTTTSTTLLRTTPTLTTTASPGGPLGVQLTDTATLSGNNPTGTITFTLFGPDNATCSGFPAFTSTRAVSGNGSVTSGAFTPSFPGTYRWRAFYSGDARNTPVTTACGDPAEVATVTGAPPGITVTKTASPASRPEPGGTFTFVVTVRNTGAQSVRITSLTDNVHGNLNGRGTCAVGAVLAPNGGAYSCSFVAAFTGNAGATQTDVVTATATTPGGTVATAAGSATVSITDRLPSATVTKSASPTSLPAPGGTFTFTVRVVNTSAEAVTITSITDDVYGNLAGRGTCATGAVLQPNGVYLCRFTGTFFGLAGSRQTDTVTVRVTDNDGSSATASGRTTVTLTGFAFNLSGGSGGAGGAGPGGGTGGAGGAGGSIDSDGTVTGGGGGGGGTGGAGGGGGTGGSGGSGGSVGSVPTVSGTSSSSRSVAFAESFES